MRKLGIPPENLQPGRYVGPKSNLTPCVEAKRRPLVIDRSYPLLTMWRVDSNPSTGSEGEVWQLVKFELGSGDATWRRIDFSSAGPGFDSITVDSFTGPGVNPVEPDGTGDASITGAAVLNHTIPVETHTRALNAFNVEVQVAKAVTGAPANMLDSGLASFDDTSFVVDGNGWVSLAGGLGPAIDSLDVDFATLPGVDPVVPSGTGVTSIFGNVVTNATNLNSPVATHTRAVNQLHVDVQLSTAITVPGDPYDVGLSSFDSSVFSVDGNGWVSLAGGGLAVDSFTVDAIAGTGVNPVVATGAGLVTVGGGVVVNSGIPLQSISRSPNNYDLEVQVAKAVTGAPGSKTGAGISTYDDTMFTCDSDGYVSLTGFAGGGGIKFLDSATASISAALLFESYINSTYNTYLFLFDNIAPVNDGDSIRMRTSTDGGTGGGGSYDSGATDYFYSTDGSSTIANYSGNGMRLSGTISNTSNADVSGRIILYTPSDSKYTYITGEFTGTGAGPNISYTSCWGGRKSAADVNAVQFYLTTGNISSGNIKMYGMTTPT